MNSNYQKGIRRSFIRVQFFILVFIFVSVVSSTSLMAEKLSFTLVSKEQIQQYKQKVLSNPKNKADLDQYIDENFDGKLGYSEEEETIRALLFVILAEDKPSKETILSFNYFYRESVYVNEKYDNVRRSVFESAKKLKIITDKEELESSVDGAYEYLLKLKNPGFVSAEDCFDSMIVVWGWDKTLELCKQLIRSSLTGDMASLEKDIDFVKKKTGGSIMVHRDGIQAHRVLCMNLIFFPESSLEPHHANAVVEKNFLELRLFYKTNFEKPNFDDPLFKVYNINNQKELDAHTDKIYEHTQYMQMMAETNTSTLRRSPK